MSEKVLKKAYDLDLNRSLILTILVVSSTPFTNTLGNGQLGSFLLMSLTIYWYSKSKFKVVETKCYLEGKEIDEENTDLYEKCFEYKPDRETYRKIYFNPDQSPNEYHLSYFDLLHEYLKNK